MDKFLSGFEIPPSASQSILDDWDSSEEKTASDVDDNTNENIFTPEKSPVFRRKSEPVPSPIITSSKRRPASSPLIQSRRKRIGNEATTPKSNSHNRKRKLILDELDTNQTPPAESGPISSAWQNRSKVKAGEVVSCARGRRPRSPVPVSGVKKFIENLLANSQELFPDRFEVEDEYKKDVKLVENCGNVSVPDTISGTEWLSTVGELEDSDISGNIDISNCDSQEGKRPPALKTVENDENSKMVDDRDLAEIMENKDTGADKNIVGSRWLSDVRSQAASGSHTSGSPDASQDTAPDVSFSGKKKKPVKKGLVAKLERTLKGVKSGRVLKNHLLRNLAGENTTGDLDLTVVSCHTASGVQVVRCLTTDSRRIVLLINEEFGLIEGEGLSISPPWCSFSLPHSSAEVVVGVTKWQISSLAPLPHPPLPSPPPVTLNMICKCQTMSREGREGPCAADDESLGISSLLALPYPTSPNMETSKVCLVTNPNIQPVCMTGSPKCVLDMVENMGGCSSSPQTTSRRPARLDLIIHRVLTRVKSNLNETLNATLACHSSSGNVDVSLLCEDPAGDFTLVKLDGELRNNPQWRSMFIDGEEWEGARVKMVGLYPQDRLTANRHGRLFGVIKSVKQTQQRFLYVLRAYGDTIIETLQSQVSQPQFIIVSEARGRCNVAATVLHQTPQILYLTDSSMQTSTINYIKVSYSSSCLFPEEMMKAEKSVTVSILGLSVDANGVHSLDCYSSIRLAPSINKTIISPPAWSDMMLEGDLVTVQGQVVAVDEERSVEWVSCGDCGREDLDEGVDGDNQVVFNCEGCRKPVKPLEHMTLMCRIRVEEGLVWIQLRDNTARDLLTSLGDEQDFAAEDLIGRKVEPLMCIVKGDILCQARD